MMLLVVVAPATPVQAHGCDGTTFATWRMSGASSAGAGITTTRPSSASGYVQALTGIVYGLDVAPTAAALVQVREQDATNTTTVQTWWSAFVTQAGSVAVNFTPPLRMAVGNRVQLSLAAGGGAAIGRITEVGFDVDPATCDTPEVVQVTPTPLPVSVDRFESERGLVVPVGIALGLFFISLIAVTTFRSR
jgi:hypothetical protein